MRHQVVIQGGNLQPVIVEKFWGNETLFGVTSRIALKRVKVRPSESLSKQVHLQKDEIYLVVEGQGQLELGNVGEILHELNVGDVVHIPPGVVHQLVGGDQGITIIEASTPELTDIVRLGDSYGRASNAAFDQVAYRNVIRT